MDKKFKDLGKKLERLNEIRVGNTTTYTYTLSDDAGKERTFTIVYPDVTPKLMAYILLTYIEAEADDTNQQAQQPKKNDQQGFFGLGGFGRFFGSRS